MSAATDDGDLTEVQNGMLGKRVAGLTLNGLIIMGLNYFRIPIYLATYRLQKNKLLAQYPAGSKTPEINSRAAALSAASLWAIAMLAVQNEMNLYIDRGIKTGDWKIFHKRRKLHQDMLPETGKIGDLMREYFWHVNRIEFKNLERNGKTIDIIVFPEFKRIGKPKTFVEIPKTLDLSGAQVRLPAEEIVEVNPDTWRTTKRPDIIVNPAAFAQWPTKHVADRKSVWNLTGRGNFGYNIYKRPKYNNPKLTGEDVTAWKQVHGQALDLYPGPNVVWAVNALKELFACQQPCDTGDWKKIPGPIRGGGPVAVAVGRAYNPTLKTTKGQNSMVWIKTSDGSIFFRPESINATTGWVDASSGTGLWRKWLPKRIRDKLKERATMTNWEKDTMYSFPPEYAK